MSKDLELFEELRNKEDEGFKAFKEVAEASEKAQEIATPVAVVADDKVAVLGDVSKTEKVTDDYQITFMIPEDQVKKFSFEPTEAKKEENTVYGKYFKLTVDFKGKTLTPRIQTRMQSTAMRLKPLINELLPDGKIKPFSEEQLLHSYMYNFQEFDQILYTFVADFLNIPEEFIEAMYPDTVFVAFMQILVNHGDLFKAADANFEQRTGQVS
ncbi:hypothetical protein M2139_001637 [Enterococcus sp. PF1-24]|uniref:hypothetical protein n=1 Tax=unclassified Enterococcus TaxID=2608891 RepID=UPI002475CA3F|nr:MULTISPECIES: hypothetical protein [unclassified Enterococcus]MDH6364650.1 hypothetical protein [Enterococcus sp. PFB1-1]MDH6401751.1 hypothetical protein [Enterococcus sp. PF1-24]